VKRTKNSGKVVFVTSVHKDGLGTMKDSEEAVSAREDELELARERGTVAK
jgi:hypothetical protein